MPTTDELQDQINTLLAIASCKLTQDDAIEVKANLNALITDLETQVSNLEDNNDELIALIVTIRQQIEAL